MDSKRNNIFSFLTETFVLFAVDILLLMLLAIFFGEGAKTISPIYRLGSQGLAIPTMLQFFLAAATVAALRALFYSDKIIKNMKAIWKATLLVISIFIIHVIYIIVFRWFSFDNYYAWLLFLVFFLGGFVAGLLFMVIKTKLENRQYDKLLSQYKNQHEGDDDNE